MLDIALAGTGKQLWIAQAGASMTLEVTLLHGSKHRQIITQPQTKHRGVCGTKISLWMVTEAFSVEVRWEKS